MNELNLNDKPELIWNLDETSLSIDPRKTKVVGQKGQPSTRTTSTSGRENVTILATVSASGKKAAPLIIFKAKFIWDQWIANEDENCFPGISYAATRNGWMESEVFLNFLKTTFLEAIGPVRPVLLVYDGHSTHVDQRVIKFAIDNSITILKMPPHTSHLLQPLDISVFKSFKDDWDQQICKWQRHNIGKRIPKKIFSELVGKTWLNIKPDIIKSGFKKAGLYPHNPNVIALEKFDPDSLRRWNQTKTIDELPNQNINSLPGPSNAPQLAVYSAEVTQSNSDQENDSGVANNGKKQKTNFENLLLSTVKQNQPIASIRKKRVAGGAAVITKLDLPKDIPQAKKYTKKLTKNRPSTSSSSSESDKDITYQESSDDSNFIGDIEIEENINFPTNVEVGSFCIVKFTARKILKYYIAQILQQHEEGFEVKFLRKAKGVNKFCWPQVEDVAIIDESDIERALPEPQMDHWGKFTFNLNFSGYNLC